MSAEIIFGGAASGKTMYRVIPRLKRDIFKHKSIIVFDPNRNIKSQTEALAKAAGYDISSVGISLDNVLNYVEAKDGIPARELTYIELQRGYEKAHGKRSFSDVLNRLETNDIEKLLWDYDAAAKISTGVKTIDDVQEWVIPIAGIMRQFYNADPISQDTALDVVRIALNEYIESLEIDRIGKKNQITYIHLNEMDIMSCRLFTLYLNEVFQGLKKKSAQHCKNVSIYLDEAGCIPYMKTFHKDALELSSKGVSFVLAYLEPSQIRTAYGDKYDAYIGMFDTFALFKTLSDTAVRFYNRLAMKNIATVAVDDDYSMVNNTEYVIYSKKWHSIQPVRKGYTRLDTMLEDHFMKR